MMRRILEVGDPPICGGRVLPYVGVLTSTIHGHQVALIGGRAYCEGCHRMKTNADSIAGYVVWGEVFYAN